MKDFGSWFSEQGAVEQCGGVFMVYCTGCDGWFNFTEYTGLDESEYDEDFGFHCGGSPLCCP